jgi:hypothetical protein
MQSKWFLSERGYALRTTKNRVSGVSMHRMLLDPPKGMMSDHINGVRLDNRRCNLRIVNALQNAQNKANHKNSRSKYRGVAWKVENDKWQARIRVVKKQYHIGLYDTELEAAAAYNNAAILHHGDYSRLNVLPEGYMPPKQSGECPLCHQSLPKREIGIDKWKAAEWLYCNEAEVDSYGCYLKEWKDRPQNIKDAYYKLAEDFLEMTQIEGQKP